MNKILKSIIIILPILLASCNSGGINNQLLTLSLNPQTCSLSQNQSITTNVGGMNANDNYVYGLSTTESGTYNSFSNPEYASGSNISISDTFTCSQITSTPGKYFIMVSDITQGLTSNPVPILIKN